MSVPRRRAMASVSEDLADMRQAFTRHDGLTGCRVPQVGQAQPAELRIRTHRLPGKV